MNKMISICLPTYNGADTIRELFDSIYSQITPDIEFVICDDGSTDNTINIIKEYQEIHSNISLYINDVNLGMDRNFAQTAFKAKGKFVWLTGQDDIFRPGVFNKFFEIYEKNPDVNFIYFNYRFLSGDLTKEVDPPRLSKQPDAFYKTPAEYFSQLDHTPSFLPATVMKQRYWTEETAKPFLGTHYVQVGVWLENFNEGNAYVVGNPDYIVCRMPEESWKYKSGQMLFEIFSGSLKTYVLNYRGKNRCFSAKMYWSLKKEYETTFISQLFEYSALGFRNNSMLKERVKYLYHDEKLKYWFFFFPLMNIPSSVINILFKFKKIIKNLVRKDAFSVAP